MNTSTSLSLSAVAPLPQTPLDKKDYPNVRYWHATSWTNSKTNTDIDIFTMSPTSKKRSLFWYLEDVNGAPLDEGRCNAVTKRARNIFAHLNSTRAGATKWGEMGNVSQDFYRREMYLFFPELQLCELDWKVNRLATETYSSWYRKRRDKFAVTTNTLGIGSSSADRCQSKWPRTPLQVPSTPYTKKVKSSAPPPRPAPRPVFRPQPNPHSVLHSTPIEEAPITVSITTPAAIDVLPLPPLTATNPASSSPPLSHTPEASKSLDLDSEPRAVCRRSTSPRAAQAAETILNRKISLPVADDPCVLTVLSSLNSSEASMAIHRP
jgi:hypothetical protein